MSEAQPPKMEKIEFVDSSGRVETLWASPLGKDLYQLDNTPFYIYDVSWQDIIEAKPRKDLFPKFKKMIKKSGNRTVRIIFDQPANESKQAKKILDTLVKMGCSYEGLTTKFIAINIPQKTELQSVYDYLTEQKIEWECGDPSYEKLYPDDD